METYLAHFFVRHCISPLLSDLLFSFQSFSLEILGSSGWRLQVQIASFKKSHRGVKYSIGNAVSNIVVTIFGVRWALEISGESLCKVNKCLITILYNCNRILYVNCNWKINLKICMVNKNTPTKQTKNKKGLNNISWLIFPVSTEVRVHLTSG